MTEEQTFVRKKNVSRTRGQSTCATAKKKDADLQFGGVLTASDACFGQGVKDRECSGTMKEPY